ncbi:serine/threonine-protein kinase [Neorhodopirellula pilleata]|uniref:serine/threonine-protein kinase n=1 Tax=Neorhodopirellula pilleata TaxID=2714738 RepID=UPI001E349AE9|nr:serine/threonine-protein kinase [Neorhodopirellula pilleata]
MNETLDGFSGEEVGEWDSLNDSIDESNGRNPDQPPKDIMLGGYRMIRELGRGAMGRVFVAEQISLQRQVAVKTIQSSMMHNPRSMARFTREAYAAAQLNHPNVVQIFDMGCEKSLHFFSMEMVDGGTLSAEIKRDGKIAPDVALRYILQAARGLRHAHDAGMVHRDIKPDNLLLSKQGLVKVADLGLVKVTDGDSEDENAGGDNHHRADDVHLTSAGAAMGTPMYMAPEQADSASEVDHRADIYSLGCTLYAMVTGNPPFTGSTVEEVITKHKCEAIKRPELIFRHIPAELGELTERMTAKRVEDRFQSMPELIQAIENFLGIGDQEGFSPTDEQIQVIYSSAESLKQLPLRRWRGVLVRLFLLSWAVLPSGAILLTFMAPQAGIVLFALSIAWLASTFATSLLIGTVRGDSVVSSKLRQLAWGSRWLDRITWLLSALMLVGIVIISGQVLVMTVAGICGVLVAGVTYVRVTRPWIGHRHRIRDKVEPTIARLRLMGYDEPVIRDFVAKFSGDQWEDLYELLFGYNAKIQQREQLHRQDRFKKMPKFEAWRDVIVRWVDARLDKIQRQRSQKHLRVVEEASLVAEGASATQARAMATAVSEAIVATARPSQRSREEDPLAARLRRKAMYARACSDAKKMTASERIERLVRRVVDPIIGARTRFLVAVALWGAIVLRLHQNGFGLEDGFSNLANLSLQYSLEPLRLPLLSAEIAQKLGAWTTGLAGVWLLLSCFFISRRKSAIVTLIGAGICVLGLPIGIPVLSSMVSTESVGVIVGLGGSLIACYLLRWIPVPFLKD